MTLRDHITQTLTPTPQATRDIWWPHRDEATQGEVERALHDLWSIGAVEGFPDGPWFLSVNKHREDKE